MNNFIDVPTERKKERPILMNGAMVRATLDGSKRQTRRIMKMKQSDWCKEIKGDCWHPNEIAEWSLQNGRWFGLMGWYTLAFADCPYGQTGDRLWVRETWQGPILDEEQLEQFREDGPELFKNPEFCVYRATDTLDGVDDEGNELGWKPSIHMPRWASRILLEIIDVRVERLQDISEADATAEGTPHSLNHPAGRTAIENYQHLWERINGDGSWDANPWVWVIEFKVVK